MTLSGLFSVVQTYKIPAMWSEAMATLKSSLPGNPFAVYLIACQHGFLEEAKAAALISTWRSYTNRDYREEV